METRAHVSQNKPRSGSGGGETRAHDEGQAAKFGGRETGEIGGGGISKQSMGTHCVSLTRGLAVQSGVSAGRVGDATNPHAQTSFPKQRRQFCTQRCRCRIFYMLRMVRWRCWQSCPGDSGCCSVALLAVVSSTSSSTATTTRKKNRVKFGCYPKYAAVIPNETGDIRDKEPQGQHKHSSNNAVNTNNH